MKSLLVALTFAVASLSGCNAVVAPPGPGTGPGPGPGPGSNPGPGHADPGCVGDHCLCTLDDECIHDCTAGGEACEVQCHPDAPCDVGCAPGEHCHVECSQTSSCEVDCGSSPECHVTCPAIGCTVKNCVGAACDVTCGTASLPSHHGSTATCP